MQYASLFTPHHLATLADWLEETGRLLVAIELPHSGGSGTHETVDSLAALKRLIDAVTHPEIEITIWKNAADAALDADQPPPDLAWIYGHPDEVLYLAVKKNRNFSLSYKDNPAKYQKAIGEWFGG